MRPGSIIKFEIFYLAAWAISVVAAILAWNAQAILHSHVGREMGVGGVAGVTVIALLVPPVLCYFAGRKRSGVARWTIATIFALQTIGVLRAVLTVTFAPGLVGALGLAIFCFRAAAMRYLFSAESRAWFAIRIPEDGVASAEPERP